MTEFELSPELKLGLMPNGGIARIIGSDPHPASGVGIPRAELYLRTLDAQRYIDRAIALEPNLCLIYSLATGEIRLVM
jgi:hypothetical protein